MPRSADVVDLLSDNQQEPWPYQCTRNPVVEGEELRHVLLCRAFVNVEMLADYRTLSKEDVCHWWDLELELMRRPELLHRLLAEAGLSHVIDHALAFFDLRRLTNAPPSRAA